MGKKVKGKIMVMWGLVGDTHQFLWELGEEGILTVHRQGWGAGRQLKEDFLRWGDIAVSTQSQANAKHEIQYSVPEPWASLQMNDIYSL